MISLIVAMTKEGVIGLDGKMPWNIPEEMALFKEKTTGSVVIMGRKTFDSIGRALPNRINIVISRDKNYKIIDATVYSSLKEGLEEAKKHNKEIYIIGGAEIYRESLQYVDRMCISYLKNNYLGNVYFPKFEEKEYFIVYKKEFKDFIYTEYMKKIR